jgi:hypothetical protein
LDVVHFFLAIFFLRFRGAAVARPGAAAFWASAIVIKPSGRSEMGAQCGASFLARAGNPANDCNILVPQTWAVKRVDNSLPFLHAGRATQTQNNYQFNFLKAWN